MSCKVVVINRFALILSGAAVGGMNGLYSGLRETKAAQLTGGVRRTQ